MGKYGLQILQKISYRAKETQQLSSKLVQGITEQIETERKAYNDVRSKLPSLKRNKNTHENNANVSTHYTLWQYGLWGFQVGVTKLENI